MVHQDLTTGFPLFNMRTLERRPEMEPDRPDRQLQHSLLPEPAYHADPAAQLGATLFAAPQRPAPGRQHWSAHRRPQHRRHTVLRAGAGPVSEELLATMRRADCLLVDGTLWRDDEMLVRGSAPSSAAKWAICSRAARAA